MYSPAMASRLVGLEPDRVRRWLQGYEYTYVPKTSAAKGRRRQSPLVRRRGALGSQYASFLDLIDLLFVKKFVEHGISVQRLRKALEEAVGLTGEHHFAQRRFWTDGQKMFLQIKDKPRIKILEQKVELLEKLPERVDVLTATVAGLSTQVLQLRGLHDDVSALAARIDERHEVALTRMGELHELAITRMLQLNDATTSQMVKLHVSTMTRIDGVRTELTTLVNARLEGLHAEMAAGFARVEKRLTPRSARPKR